MVPVPSKVSPATPGVLLILNDVAAGSEEEFNRWYRQQHIPERLGVPGFKTARRYHAVDGEPAYMAVYECRSIEVLASKAYQQRLAHPTDWTRKVMPNFRNMLRSACRETWSVGVGVGTSAIVVQCKPTQGREDAARRFVSDHLARGLMQPASLVRMSLWEADAVVTGGPSLETALRGSADKSADWILFLESHDVAKTALALRSQLSACAAGETGLHIGARTGYQLIYARAA
jgi:hypothetical protein